MQNNINRAIGLKIKARRELKNISQDELALKINTSKQYIKKYEDGSVNISVLKLYEISESLNTDIGYFLNTRLKDINQVEDILDSIQDTEISSSIYNLITAVQTVQ